MNTNSKKDKIRFDHFLEKFPEIELPIILNDEIHREFSQNNDPLNPAMLQQFIYPLEGRLPDELTEFIACFRLPQTLEFHAIVYWKASLMNYQYMLATFTKKGAFIDKRVIGGTFSDGKLLTQSIATIDEDWIITIASGQNSVEQPEYNASSSTAYQLELLPEGKIINV